MANNVDKLKSVSFGNKLLSKLMTTYKEFSSLVNSSNRYNSQNNINNTININNSSNFLNNSNKPNFFKSLDKKPNNIRANASTNNKKANNNMALNNNNSVMSGNMNNINRNDQVIMQNTYGGYSQINNNNMNMNMNYMNMFNPQVINQNPYPYQQQQIPQNITTQFIPNQMSQMNLMNTSYPPQFSNQYQYNGYIPQQQPQIYHAQNNNIYNNNNNTNLYQ